MKSSLSLLMKYFSVGFLIVCFALTYIANSQEQLSVQRADSSVNAMQSSHSESLFVRPLLFHPQSLWFFDNPFAIQSPVIFGTFQEKTYLMSPWKLEMENQEKFGAWQTILQSIELGGVSYIGYEHLKKYGLK